MASVTQSTRDDGKTYADVIQQMKDAGIKTTGIRQGREADFEDYGNALSKDVKKMIMDSFDCEQDYALQKQLAGLFTSRHDVKNGDFMKACRSMGLTVTRKSVKTQYMPDYKGGNFSNGVRNGSLSVFTISDGKGGEIVIVDSNGNGAIESEELFMNQLLGDINMELTGVQAVNYAAGTGAISPAEAKQQAKEELQNEFNSKVEEYLKAGKTKSEAELSAGIDVNDVTLSYTGSMQETVEKVDNAKFNSVVEEYLSQNYDVHTAELMASLDLGVNNYRYTGNNSDKGTKNNDKVNSQIKGQLDNHIKKLKNEVKKTTDNTNNGKITDIINKYSASENKSSMNIFNSIKSQISDKESVNLMNNILSKAKSIQELEKELMNFDK